MQADQVKKPASPLEAEKIAAEFVGQYLTACRMKDEANIGNYLMKLCSVAGVLMAQAEGIVTAANRLADTAVFILHNMPADPGKLERMQ